MLMGEKENKLPPKQEKSKHATRRNNGLMAMKLMGIIRMKP